MCAISNSKRATGPSEVFGEVAAPQLEGVVTPDEIVINDIVLKRTSPVKYVQPRSFWASVRQIAASAHVISLHCVEDPWNLQNRDMLKKKPIHQQDSPAKESVDCMR